MASNAIVNRQVNIYINSGDAQKNLDKLIAKEKILKDELAKATDPKKIAALNKEIAKLGEPIDRATKKLKGDLLPTFKELELATRRWLNEFKRTGDPAALANFQKFNAELIKQKGLINNLNDAQNKLTKKGIFSAAFWANLAAGGIQAAASAIRNFFSGAFDEALEANRVTTQLHSTLDNLGRTEVFDRLMRKADEMAKRFKFLDNDDVVGVFNKLIDYGKLTEQQMNDLLPVIIDFAAKTRQDLGSATDIIIKALEGSGKALKTFGIDLKDTKNETEAFNIVMTDLKSKVDGAGEAFANMDEGGIAIARQEMKNLQEDIGNGMIPALNWLLHRLKDVKDGFTVAFKFARERIAGGSGFFDITVDKIHENPSFNKEVEQLAEGFVKSFQSVSNSIADKKLVPEVQKKITDNLKTQIAAAEQELDAFRKNAKRDDDVAIRDLLATIESRQQALDAIDALLNKKTLGIKSTSGDKIKDVNVQLVAMKKIIEEIALNQEGVDFFDRIQKQAAAAKEFLKNENLKKTFDSISGEVQRRNVGILNSVFDSVNRNNVAGLQLRLIQSHGKEKMQAELDLLKEQEKQELQQKDLTENEKLLIEERYRQLRMEKEVQHWQGIFDTTIQFAQQSVAILDTLFSAANAKEDAQLERDRRVNDQKKNNFKRQLDGKMISQLEYDRQLRKLDKEQAKHEYDVELKKFKRNQITSIAQALINGAQGATKTIAELGFPAAIPFLIAEGAAVLANVIAITKQKPAPPVAFAQGGKLGGRSHADGGNPILDGSGRKIAEIEAGEGIINKRSMGDGKSYTISGTPSQIASRINSLHGGVSWESGAVWRTITPQRMNFSAMKRAYADGGVFNQQSNNQSSTDNSSLSTTLIMLTNAVAKLEEQMKKPTKNYVKITDVEDAQVRIDTIRSEATIKA